jgi:hypothetical protein
VKSATAIADAVASALLRPLVIPLWTINKAIGPTAKASISPKRYAFAKSMIIIIPFPLGQQKPE